MNKFINWAKANHKKYQLIAAIVIGGSSAILFLVLGINLLYEERYRPAIGIIIASTFLFLCVAFSILDPEIFKLNKISKKIKRDLKKQDSRLCGNDEKILKK